MKRKHRCGRIGRGGRGTPLGSAPRAYATDQLIRQRAKYAGEAPLASSLEGREAPNAAPTRVVKE